MLATGAGRRDAVPPSAASGGRTDRFAHPAVIVTVGIVALLTLLALARVAGGAVPVGSSPGPLTPRCSDAALAVVDDVRSAGRLVADWPARVVDGRCATVLRFDGSEAEVSGRVGVVLRDLGYRVEGATSSPDGSVELSAAPASGGSVLLTLGGDGDVVVRVSPP